MHISVPITLILSIHDLLFKSKKRTIKSNNGAQSMRTETRYAQITHVYFSQYILLVSTYATLLATVILFLLLLLLI